MCTDLTTLIQERAEIEKIYAKHLKTWSKKWGDLIEKGIYAFQNAYHILIVIFITHINVVCQFVIDDLRNFLIKIMSIHCGANIVHDYFK